MRELINKLKYAFVPHTINEVFLLKVGDVGNLEIFIKEAVKVSGFEKHQKTTSDIVEAVAFTNITDCLAYKKNADLASEIKVVKKKFYAFSADYNYM